MNTFNKPYKTNETFVTSANRVTVSDPHYNFQTPLVHGDYHGVTHLRLRQVTITFTRTPTSNFINGFIYFPDLKYSKHTSSGEPYHYSFFIAETPIGTQVSIGFTFEDDNDIDFYEKDTLRRNFRTQLFVIDSNGNKINFTELSNVSYVLEFRQENPQYR